EAVVDRLLEWGGLFHKTGGYQSGSDAIIAGAREDRVAAPNAERVVAGDRGAQQWGWNRREEGLHDVGDRLRQAGVEPYLRPVEAPHEFLQLPAAGGERPAARVEARVGRRPAGRGGIPNVTVAGRDEV